MTQSSPSASRVAVWSAMAEHFLDTETRQDLPLTALRCLEAGLSPDEARQIWQHEVTPAVGFNLRSLAGEWAFWDTDWLVARIERARERWWNRSRCFARYRWPAASGEWLTIERCMQHLLTAAPATRALLAQDLACLARHCFDFHPSHLAELEPEARARISALLPEPFLHLMRPALLSRERPFAKRRLQAALEQVSP